MKQIITLCACFPIAIILILQIGLTYTNNADANYVRNIVEETAQTARWNGCFTVTEIDNMKSAIATKMDIAPEEIKVTATTIVQYKPTHYENNAKIEYRVEVPIRKVIIAGNFFGISDDDNKGTIIKEGYVISERLKP